MHERVASNLESEQKELLRLVDSLNVNVRESETQREILQQRLEEASNTILRLRPPRQEYTESEIEEDYERLIKAIKNWVSVNCEAFLDDDSHGYGALLRHSPHQSNYLEPFEEIIAKFHSKFSQWAEPKEHVLVAVVMRPEERSTLASIEKGLKDPRLQKDFPTIRAWRNDTITAVDSYPSFTKRATSIESVLTSDLHNYFRGALSGENENSIKWPLRKEVIAPAMGLAHKTQSTSSIWEFGYSDYLASKPGEFGSRLSNFLANIQYFRCINLSKRGKLLKEDTDLTTKEEQESLCYMLDIFPGLYCQRVAAGSSPLSSTISQPILLVAFATEDGLGRTQQSHSVPSNPETSTQNGYASATHPVSPGRRLVAAVFSTH
ncbi:hypothetical protein F5882DRAFT_509748 [Hyaloscypha sp. PMI_1271]|nr:hypothetical protein F5882DRAFT_509748 [Hyaloscypha sp. PMI_1271]